MQKACLVFSDRNLHHVDMQIDGSGLCERRAIHFEDAPLMKEGARFTKKSGPIFEDVIIGHERRIHRFVYQL